MAALALTAGCGKKKSPRDPTDVAATGRATRSHDLPEVDPGGTSQPDDLDRDLPVDPVYFEYDSAELSQRGREELTKVASWLARHPAAKLHIEGHTDDRGTTEYNLGLGERRAQVIADYLARLGIERARLDTISFGEEKPAVDEDSEQAWAMNRRGALDVQR